MPKKISKTALNIRSINSYIQTVAKVFGTGSAEYQAATVPLKQFDIRDKHVNGQTIVQIKNTAENRKKHQTIRAIKNRRKPVQILKRRYEKQKKAYLQNIPSIERGEKAKDFYRWLAELRKEFDDVRDEVYTLNEALEKIGMAQDWTKPMWKDSGYRANLWEKVYDNGGSKYATYSDFMSWLNNVDDVSTDENTGESYEYDNDDYAEYDMGLDYD